jgi:tripartite-type tricarboxylate transporter receptor subunit TctC
MPMWRRFVLAAGHLPVGWTSAASATPHLPTGRVRVLATAGASRTPFFPDAPTLAEAGIALSGWVAQIGPAALSPAVAEHLHALLRPAFAGPDLCQRLQTLGTKPDLRPAEALLEELRREDAFWAAVAQAGTPKPPR